MDLVTHKANYTFNIQTITLLNFTNFEYVNKFKLQTVNISHFKLSNFKLLNFKRCKRLNFQTFKLQYLAYPVKPSTR